MKKILAATLLTVATTSAFAASETYQATVTALQEPTITETAALNFGSIVPTATSTCNMDNAGTITGACDASDANILIGAVSLTDLVANTALTVTITGGSSANLTFDADWDINNAGTGDADGITDGTATNITVDGTASTITLDVYGDMTVDTALTSGQTYTVDYTVEVVFQ
ncbi:MAG: hypothetical protein Alis3KO_24190 [Aliiglaciecola sp.]|uniref:hypothetical protein n=1 Tax=Aliiglaciecola sp. M165 TaxID=2593649 RepID=UPI00117E52C7|nr:hypothetical protein [Aliiglaciecola sp. M165]TRY33247.1 hypothetical protein FM019_04490 [Aliiglaciecola sp. M165]